MHTYKLFSFFTPPRRQWLGSIYYWLVLFCHHTRVYYPRIPGVYLLVTAALHIPCVGLRGGWGLRITNVYYNIL